MNRVRLGTIGGLAAVVAALFWGCGEAGMFGRSADIELSWQWPAERMPSAWSVMASPKIEEKSTGLFGIGASPSIAGNLPDAQTLSGELVAGADAGKTATIDLPGLEAQKLAEATQVALGRVEDGVVICTLPVPDDLSAERALAWAEKAGCGR